jgi:hypothetical protein
MTDHSLQFTLHAAGRREAVTVPLREAVIAGWTGRDAAARDKHIRELAELGIAPPSSTPVFYRVAASRFTTAGRIEVLAEDSSGEVEFVLIQHEGRFLVGVGSDHTDRKVEAYNISVSKQMCEKPVAPELWDFAEVEDHWDQLMLRSWIQEGGARVLYQEGPVAGMLAPQDLIGRFRGGGLPDGLIMLGGTHPAKGGIRSSLRFDFELEDPVLGRAIRHGYDMSLLPIVS